MKKKYCKGDNNEEINLIVNCITMKNDELKEKIGKKMDLING